MKILQGLLDGMTGKSKTAGSGYADTSAIDQLKALQEENAQLKIQQAQREQSLGTLARPQMPQFKPTFDAYASAHDPSSAAGVMGAQRGMGAGFAAHAASNIAGQQLARTGAPTSDQPTAITSPGYGALGQANRNAYEELRRMRGY